MPLRSIAYASEAIPGLSTEVVDGLMRNAARFNVEAGVTGILLYDGSRFLQYIEGPDDGMDVVYSRILQATSHREIVELGRGRHSKRQLPYWAMRLVPSVADEIRDLARSDWTGLRCRESAAGQMPNAMNRLAEIVAPYVQI